MKKKYKELEKKKKNEEKEEIKRIRKSIPKTLKDSLWDKHFGEENGSGKCFVCPKKIFSRNFECGHVISVKEGGPTTLDNLRPICGACNKSMKTENLLDFKKKYYPEESKLTTPKLTTPKLSTPIEEFVESKVKYNSELVYKELDFPGTPQYGFPKMKTDHKISREIKLDTIYKHYRNWLHENHPQIHKDTQFEGCFGENATYNNIKEIIIQKYGQPINTANFCNPSEAGKTIFGWKNIEIVNS